MKKYLFGFIAVILAVGFSAFTNIHMKQRQKNTLQSYLNWYATDDGNTVSEVLYHSTTVPKNQNEIISMGIPCTPSSGVVCVRGSNQVKAESDPLPDPDTDSDIERAAR